MAANPNVSLLSKRIFRLFGKYDQQPSLVKSLLLTFLLIVSFIFPAYYANAITANEEQLENTTPATFEVSEKEPLVEGFFVESNTAVEESITTEEPTSNEIPFEKIEDYLSESIQDEFTEDLGLSFLWKDLSLLADTTKPTLKLKSLGSVDGGEPLIILDGVILQKENGVNPLQEIDPNNIKQVDVLKGENATALYGSKARHGVVIITTKGYKMKVEPKDTNTYIRIRNRAAEAQKEPMVIVNGVKVEGEARTDKLPLYILDGKKIRREEGKDVLKELDPNEIDHIEVIKGEAAIQKYGEEGRDGVILITSKKAVAKSKSVLVIVDGVRFEEYKKGYYRPVGSTKTTFKKRAHLYNDPDGKLIKTVIEGINEDEIEIISFYLKKELFGQNNTVDKYGKEAKNGVLMITTKHISPQMALEMEEVMKEMGDDGKVEKVEKIANVVIGTSVEKVEEIKKSPANARIDKVDIVKIETVKQGQATIEGNVSDVNGIPLIGVAIIVKDKNIGTITDLKGNFKMNLPDSCVSVIFSFVGKEQLTLDMVCGMSSQVNVVLKEPLVEELEKPVKEDRAPKAVTKKKPANTTDFKKENLTGELAVSNGITAYPNPFEEEINIEFNLKNAERVDLSIFDMYGKLVKQIYSGKDLGDGFHQFIWNPVNVAQGVYLISLNVNDKVFTKKISLK